MLIKRVLRRPEHCNGRALSVKAGNLQPVAGAKTRSLFDVTKHPILGIDSSMVAGLRNREFNG
jgi:hypothetical protein